MNYLWVFLIIFVLALLQTSLIPLNLVLLLVLSWSILRWPEEGFLTSFLAGLILDFLNGRTLGFSSLLFIILSLIIYLYKNRFRADKPAFLLPLTLLAVVATNFFFKEQLSILTIGLNTVLILFCLPLLKNFSKIDRENQRLEITAK